MTADDIARHVAEARPGPRPRVSTKLVATVVGPAHSDALSKFTQCVAGEGASLGGSRLIEVSGTVTVSSVVYLPDKPGVDAIDALSSITWALQTSLQGFIVTVKPAIEANPPTVFARVTVSGADRMGILAEVADYLDSRSIQVATMRTQTDASRYGADGIEGTDDDEDPLYNCVATLASHNPSVDLDWIEAEVYEFGDKADLSVSFERLASE